MRAPKWAFRNIILELSNKGRRFCSAMEDASTYRQYAEECRKLAKSMPEHHAKLVDMAKVWLQLAAKVDGAKDGNQK
jgi:hypothetical protein